MTDLESLSIATLATVYNGVAEKKVNKFSSKAEAVRRTARALEAAGKTLVTEPSGAVRAVPVARANGHANGRVSPGMNRLRNSPRYEAIVAQNLEEQSRAFEAAKRQRAGQPPAPARRAGPAQSRTSDSGPPSNRRGPATKYRDDQKIRILTPQLAGGVHENPKRAGTDSHARFAMYRDGMTVGEYVKLVGRRYATADIRWDSKQGFIRVE